MEGPSVVRLGVRGVGSWYGPNTVPVERSERPVIGSSKRPSWFNKGVRDILSGLTYRLDCTGFCRLYYRVVGLVDYLGGS